MPYAQGPLATHANPLWIGGRAAATAFFDGKIDEVRVEETARLSGQPPHAVATSQSPFTPGTGLSLGAANQVPGLAVTITTSGGDLEIDGTLFVDWSVSARGEFTTTLDGEWVGAYLGGGSSWTLWYDGIFGAYAGNSWDTRSYHRVVPNVPAGTHTIPAARVQ